MASHKIIMYIDGGARGNPGKAAIGVVIEPDGKTYQARIGETTNNVAEYKALILGLKKAKELYGQDNAKMLEIEVRSDSELMVKQMKGLYRVKDEKLSTLFGEAKDLIRAFKKVTLTAIPREKNQKADALVNAALDGKL